MIPVEFVHHRRAGILLLLFSVLAFTSMSSKVDPYVLGLKTIGWYIISPEIVYTGRFFNQLDSLKGQIFRLFRVDGENFLLRKENSRLSKMELERNALLEENNHLRGLLDLKQKNFAEGVAAEVVGRDMRNWFQAVILDKGERAGIVLSAAVLAGMPGKFALVGRVKELSETNCKVLLLTDALSAESAVVSGKGDVALLVGQNKPWLILNFLSPSSQVADGDVIVTAGLGGIFPPDIPIGMVSDVYISKDGYFKSARVDPFNDFNSFREVLILHRDEKLGEEPK